jgi:hypothetical protein
LIMQEEKPQRDETTGRFLPGNHNGGRPIGSRPKIAESFLQDVKRPICTKENGRERPI